MAEDSQPGSLDPTTKQPYHRRMTEQKIQSFADSAMLKIMQFALTALFVPLSFIALNAVLARISALEDAVNKANTANATYELRLQTLERAQVERDTSIRLLTEKSIVNDYEVRNLKAQQSGRLPQR